MVFWWAWAAVTTSSTVTNPFILISGDRQEDMKAAGPAIIIGMKTNIHFQSLLSVGQDLPLRYPEIPSNPITLTLEHLGESLYWQARNKDQAASEVTTSRIRTH